MLLLRFGLTEDGFLPRTAVANQSIPSFSPNPSLAEQLCTAHFHVSPFGLMETGQGWFVDCLEMRRAAGGAKLRVRSVL